MIFKGSLWRQRGGQTGWAGERGGPEWPGQGPSGIQVAGGFGVCLAGQAGPGCGQRAGEADAEGDRRSPSLPAALLRPRPASPVQLERASEIGLPSLPGVRRRPHRGGGEPEGSGAGRVAWGRLAVTGPNDSPCPRVFFLTIAFTTRLHQPNINIVLNFK